MLVIILYLLSSISIWIVFKNTVKARFGFWYTLFAITVLTVLIYVSIVLLNLEFLANITIVAVLSIIAYKKSSEIIALSVFYAIVAMIVSMVIGNIIGTIIIVLFSTTIPDAREGMVLYYVGTIFNLLTIYGVSPILGRLLHDKIDTLSVALKKKLSTYMLIGASLTWVIYLTTNFLLDYISDFSIKDTINTVLIISYFIFMLIALNAFVVKLQAETELKNKEKLLEQLHAYTSSLETISDEMRKFRHDHVNMLSGLFGYIENGDTDGLRNYLAKYVSPLTSNIQLANASLDKLRNIKIPELKGVLLVKLIHAQELGIQVHVEVYDEIVSLNFDLVDLCRVVGVLLDNAIEAFDSDAEDNNFELRFAAVKKEASTQLIFENTATKPSPMARIFEKGFSTKSDGRGLGLYIVKQIIDKHGNTDILAESRDGLFSIIIDIANDKM